ncbi:glycine-rich domain-containing protein [Legionella longbeachae]|uniref:hypothetical protein n=1 Tax=Legionella longbeachae TaxID=450 RepID=UPI001CDA058B|nr:hypothetical protein [Legionella longbeachae]
MALNINLIMNLPDLNKLISYENDKIISRYRKDYPNSKMNAEDALKEFMKFVWLCHKHRVEKKNCANGNSLAFSCVIHSDMRDIDNMWHTFLLFTRDYHDFCDLYLDGVFFHHDPLINPDRKVFDKNDEEELTLYLSYIYDNLGEDTLIKWFHDSIAIEDGSLK